jgi:hypothetical protein
MTTIASVGNLFHGFKILVNSWIKTLTKAGILSHAQPITFVANAVKIVAKVLLTAYLEVYDKKSGIRIFKINNSNTELES